MDQLKFDVKRTAILCMDFQTGIVQNFSGGDADGLLQRTNSLLAAGRAAQAMIGYVVVEFRPGYPEVSARNQTFGAIRQTGRFLHGAAGTEIHPAVSPKGQEAIVAKHRVNAFVGTDLEVLLRANQIDTLVLAGIATSGVVLSTLRYAADTDYRIVVAKDCCADGDPEVHRCLMEKVFPRQAVVTDAAAIIAALGAARA